MRDSRFSFGRGVMIGRVAVISMCLMPTIIPVLVRVSADSVVAAKTKPPPPPSTGASWIRAYNIPYTYSRAESIAQTTGGGYVVGGSCTGGVSTSACADVSEPAAMVMTVDSSGNIQSQTQYLYKNYPYSTPSGLIRPTSDGGAIFAGNAQFGCPAIGQTSCASIVKVDSTGKIQWANDLQFSTSSSYGPLTWPLDLQTTTDGGFVIAGYAFAPASSYNPFVVKLDSTGNPQFATTYLPSGSVSQLTITGVQQTADGGYAFAGYYFQNTIYDQRAWLVKTDSTGKVQWDKIYGPDVQYSDRSFLSFQQTSDGGFIAAGSTNEYNSG